MTVQILHGDCIERMRALPENSVDAIVTDPPYELGFMGKSWDASGIAYSVEMWREALRVLKPGGHLLAFSGSRTYHRMVVAIEDAGFEIRDQIMWVYGSGFPKSLDVSKAIDKAAGAEREVVGQKGGRYAYGFTAESAAPLGRNAPRPNAAENKARAGQITTPATDAARQWQGWGTALKPAHEPICVARKPLVGTVAENVLAFGTGAINVDGCRVEGGERPLVTSDRRLENNTYAAGLGGSKCEGVTTIGRWPANLIHDGSEEVLQAFPQAPGQLARASSSSDARKTQNAYSAMRRGSGGEEPRLDAGSAARFFYCAKASKSDRGEGNNHPTVKPTDLMRYLCRLVTPPGGTVLDPFTGSGSTGRAAIAEGFAFIGIEREAAYVAIAKQRLGIEDTEEWMAA